MLKTRVDNELWLVRQPDHARVAGYLAAHWGNRDGFVRPGYYAAPAKPEIWREEVIFAIAEHDNGWWEWEAMPPIDPRDGLPTGLADIGRRMPNEGLERWRIGVPRFAEQHPYAALLMSLHPIWLYRFALEDLVTEEDEALRHPLCGGPEAASQLVVDRDATGAFLEEQEGFQNRLRQRLRADSVWRDALEPDILHPHLKLLQLLDAFSLLLSFGAQSEEQLADVPRASWCDRVTITWCPRRDHRVVCAPYPFDQDPLEVLLPARVLMVDEAGAAEDHERPLARLHAAPARMIRFELCSGMS